MTILGIALIFIGLALVCGGLISWPRASRTEEEEKTELRTEEKLEGGRASKTGSEADPAPATLTDVGIDKHGMEDLLRRLDDSFK
jgi:hypothetical protein